MEKSKKYLACIIALSTLIAVLSIVGISLLCIFMPNDSWVPFENIKVGTYTTQDDCAEVFGSNKVKIEIRNVNAVDIDEKAALAMISDKLMLNVYVGEDKADIRVVGTHYKNVIFVAEEAHD